MTPTRWPAGVARAIIRAYQLTLSPFIGNQCRFHPSCSHYALQAVDRHGAVRGGWLAVKRLGRCHPFNPGGFDPVPGCQDPGCPAPDCTAPAGAESRSMATNNNRTHQSSDLHPTAKEI